MSVPQEIVFADRFNKEEEILSELPEGMWCINDDGVLVLRATAGPSLKTLIIAPEKRA